MEAGGKYSILVIYTGYDEFTENLIVTAARRPPIDDRYDPHEGKRVMEFQWKTWRSATEARQRMLDVRAGLEPRWKQPWVGKVMKDDFVGG